MPRSPKTVPSLGYGDYVRLSKLLEARFGLHFPEKRRAELELGVRHAYAASTCTGMGDYYRLLQTPADGAMEMQRLINALTVSETHFFRDAAQFDALYSRVLPQIIERRRAARTLRIWSAGCASGEEPYSIAMVLRELLPDVDEWAITILGTDINTESLDRARKAVYSDWAFREERARQWRARYFRPKGNRHELTSEVRRMVTFVQLNLAEDGYPAYETNTMFMDLILCRNVTIYFTESVTRKVIERLYDALVDGGWLVVGHSEPSLITYCRFQVRNYPGAILYQRTGQPIVSPWDWDWPATSPAGVDKGRRQGSDMPVSLPTPVPAPINVQPTPPAGAGRCSPEDGDPLERAQEVLEYGRSEEARDLLLKLVRSRPEHAPASALLGQAYANLGHWEKAEHWCREAIRSDKLALEAYYTLALVLQHRKQLDQAITVMKKVVYIDRHNVLGHFGLADLYRSSGQLPQALKSLDNARRLLNGRAGEELIPGSGGITVGSLRETIIRQQQQWSAKASGLLGDHPPATTVGRET
jgi:chemotaxis protein methyltransferase CheR